MSEAIPDLDEWRHCHDELPPLNVRVRLWDISRNEETHGTRIKGIPGAGEWMWSYKGGVASLQSLFSHWQFVDSPSGLDDNVTL